MIKATPLPRRAILLAGAALAAGAADAQTPIAPINADDMVLGAAGARVTLVEYASVMCSHCAHFHAEVWPRLKANYIDAGRIRFVMREIPAPAQAASVVVAGFQIARCENATPQQYYARVDTLFDRQGDIFASATMADVRNRLVEIGAASGLSEVQVMACVTDRSGLDRVNRTLTAAQAALGDFGTPTLVLDGARLTDPSAYTYEGLARLLDAALAD